MTILNLFW